MKSNAEVSDGERLDLDLTSLNTYCILGVAPGEPEKGNERKERKGEGEGLRRKGTVDVRGFRDHI